MCRWRASPHLIESGRETTKARSRAGQESQCEDLGDAEEMRSRSSQNRGGGTVTKIGQGHRRNNQDVTVQLSSEKQGRGSSEQPVPWRIIAVT